MENYKPSAHIMNLGDHGFITVVINNETLTYRASDNKDTFDKLIDAFRSEDWESLYTLMRPVKAIVESVDGVEVRHGEVYWKDRVIHNSLTQRIIDFANAGLSWTPLARFLNKLMSNPSKRAVDELYTFLEHKNLPITENGNFLAYKGIQKDWYSITASMIDGTRLLNTLGSVVEMPRNEVDDDKEVGCSKGLHAGTMEYACSFGRGGRVVIVEINPADVVSIPTDCQFQKLRTCKYKVVDEYTGPLVDPCYASRWDDVEDDDNYDSAESHGESSGEFDDESIVHRVFDSSLITEGWYNDYTQQLALILRDPFVVYVYHDVPRFEWDNLCEDGSPGWTFNSNIRDYYGCDRWSKDDFLKGKGWD